MSANTLPKELLSLKWLVGKWKSINGKAIYPTMNPVHYVEEIEFSNVGQPLLMYSTSSSNPENGKPMHFERGFLRMKPDSNSVAFLVAHNFGVTEVSEGEVIGMKLTLKSTNINRASFTGGSTVLQLQRTMELTDTGNLKNTIFMETSTQPLQLHLEAEYQKMDN